MRVNLLGPGPRLIKKIIYRAAVPQRLRNTVLDGLLASGFPIKALYVYFFSPACDTHHPSHRIDRPSA